MTLLKKNALMEDEFCLLSEMEMLQVYGGNSSARYVGNNCDGAGNTCKDVGNGCSL